MGPDPLIDLVLVDLWLFMALCVLMVLYSIIIYKLLRIVRENEAKNTDANKAIDDTNDRIKRVIRMIGIYPIAYFCQWFAYALLKLGWIQLSWPVLIYIVLTTNFGGCFNCLLYGPLLFNQIKRAKEKKKHMMSSQMTNTVMTDGSKKKLHASATSQTTEESSMVHSVEPTSPSGDVDDAEDV